MLKLDNGHIRIHYVVSLLLFVVEICHNEKLTMKIKTDISIQMTIIALLIKV